MSETVQELADRTNQRVCVRYTDGGRRFALVVNPTSVEDRHYGVDPIPVPEFDRWWRTGG